MRPGTPFVLITVFTVTPEKQQKFLDTIGETITDDVASDDHPGVLSARLYRSGDGTRVVASRETHRVAHERPGFTAAVGRLAGLSEGADTNTYELTFDLIPARE